MSALKQQTIRVVAIIVEGVSESDTKQLIGYARTNKRVVCLMKCTTQIARVTDRIYEGIAIGGDVFPESTLSEHVLRFNNIPQVKMILILGEHGSRDVYSLVKALKQGKINKPVVAWVSGTCARLFNSEVQFGHAGAKSGRLFKSEVQFGHAGAKSGDEMESAQLRTKHFMMLELLSLLYLKLVEGGKVTPIKEVQPSPVPVDLNSFY